MKKNSKILLGLATIFTAGAVVGMLYAPDKGERTRRRINRKYDRLVNNFDDAVAEGKDQLNELKDGVRDKVEQLQFDLERLNRCYSKSE